MPDSFSLIVRALANSASAGVRTVLPRVSAYLCPQMVARIDHNVDSVQGFDVQLCRAHAILVLASIGAIQMWADFGLVTVGR